MIHLITPCSRPANLPRILESIEGWLDDLEWRWWTILDVRVVKLANVIDERQTILRGNPGELVFGAGFLRNLALRQIDYGWVYDLDDDTILHPNFADLLENVPAGKQAFFFDQVDKEGRRICGPDGPYGTGMGAIRRDAIIQEWDPDSYDTDQNYFRVHLEKIPVERQICFPEVGAYYNYLRGD